MKRFTDKINESLENKIPTASEFLSQTSLLNKKLFPKKSQDFDQAVDRMIEFAKLHVRAAVKEQIRIENDRATEEQIDKLTDEALRRTYPLQNIK